MDYSRGHARRRAVSAFAGSGQGLVAGNVFSALAGADCVLVHRQADAARLARGAVRTLAGSLRSGSAKAGRSAANGDARTHARIAASRQPRRQSGTFAPAWRQRDSIAAGL